jgi:hypothetical protein
MPGQLPHLSFDVGLPVTGSRLARYGLPLPSGPRLSESVKYLKIFASSLVALVVLLGIVLLVAGWDELRSNFGSVADARASLELLRSDWAISRQKSWRLRLTDSTWKNEWWVNEAIIPDREHSWARNDHDAWVGNLEYIRIKDDRYFKGDAMPDHAAAPEWIRLSPRVMPIVGHYFELRFHLSNPRTIGYSFDSIKTSMWSNYSGLHLLPGGVRDYSGHECRDWTFSWTIEETGQRMDDSVCLGTRDHLPYHLTAGGGREEVTYEWNPTISIEAPDPVKPQPKGFSGPSSE